MARCDWERMFWIFIQEDISLYFNLTKGRLKTENKTTRPSDPAQSIDMCIVGREQQEWVHVKWHMHIGLC